MSETPSTAGDPTEEEVAADEAARIADPFRYALAALDRGAAARRITEALALRYRPSTTTPATDPKDAA